MEKLIISEERAEASPPVSLISLRGTIETTNASGLEETLERVINDRCYRIVVDLGAISYISSAGWGIFISEIKRIRRNGGDIKLVGMSPEVREVFELLEFNSILRPFDNTADALNDFDSVDSGVSGQGGATST
jgi:anti-sigma B factor antagonist